MAVKTVEEIGGLTPVQVLLHQMSYYHDRSLRLRDDLHALIAADEGGANADGIEKIKSEMHRCSEMARTRAADCAPYVHARLASVDLQVEQKPPEEVARQIEALARMLDERAAEKVKIVDVQPVTERLPGEIKEGERLTAAKLVRADPVPDQPMDRQSSYRR